MRNDIIITQPRRLERQAILKLNRWIMLQAQTLTDLHARNPAEADEMLPKQIESTQNYIEHNLLRAYYDELFKEVLESLIDLFGRTRWADHNGRWNALGRMIETVLSENLTVLSMRHGWEMFEAVFESKCEKLTGLQYLKVPPKAREQVVIKLLEKAHGLRRLSIESINMHTTNILKCMVQNCKLVEELFFYECCVTDDDVNILTELRNLRYVNLERISNYVSDMAIEKLLMSCENLERLEIFSFRDILKIIERASKINETPGKQLKLNSYHNYYGRMQKQVPISFRNCPFIQELGLYKNNKYNSPIVGDPINLEPVKELQHLRKLYIGVFDFYTDRVNEVLKAKGRDLTVLGLWKVTGIDLHSLKYISVMCPRLQNYDISGCSFVRETLVEENEIEISPLKYVESFNLRLWNDESPSLEQLHLLLTNHPRVEVLKINNTNMIQDVIMTVLDKNPESLRYLRYFETNERLSMLVIDRIVQNCIYPIEVKAMLLT